MKDHILNNRTSVVSLGDMFTGNDGPDIDDYVE